MFFDIEFTIFSPKCVNISYKSVDILIDLKFSKFTMHGVRIGVGDCALKNYLKQKIHWDSQNILNYLRANFKIDFTKWSLFEI